MVDSNLLFRRQFLMTPDAGIADAGLAEAGIADAGASLSHWQQTRVGHYRLYAHPDSQLSSVTSADATVTAALVGFIIDPDCPESSNVDVLNTIVGFAGLVVDLADLVARISDYLSSVSGRFVLVISTPQETLLFHDPCGLRTVYYTKYQGKTFVGSQPLIFKHVLPLEEGERFASYMGSSYVQTHIEHWIPSGCSLYEEVHQLVPNHYLRLSTLEQIRYWPLRKLSQRPASEVVAEASDLLRRIMLAAANRFRLALPLTVGWDSRTILSASKSIAPEMVFFTLQYRDLQPQSNDIRIPAKLLRSLGLKHNIIDCNIAVPEAFREMYQRNAAPAHMDDWGYMAYAMFLAIPQDRVCVKGNCSEVAKCFYYKSGAHPPITSPDQITALVNGWQTIPFIREQIATWYDQASEVSAGAAIDILDLFYWEHRMGGWQAQGQLEWDIVQEAFTPADHRGLLELLLSTPAELRSAPDYHLLRMILKALWPEVLRQPVNPAPAERRLTKLFRNLTALTRGISA